MRSSTGLGDGRGSPSAMPSPKEADSSPTADAMAMERICKEKGISGRLIPVPRILSAGCGLAWAAPPEDKELIEKILAEREINRAGVNECMV